MPNAFLRISDLYVEIDGKEIIKGLNLEVQEGEIHVIMGPNGAGKSTLANVLLGHPKYEITAGKIEFAGNDITELKTHERAQLGLFLSFQYPQEIPGITLENFLRSAKSATSQAPVKVLEFQKLLKRKMEVLEMDPKYAARYLNHGFSGGEKKKSEILQLLVLDPKLAILDETDSGLDVDAVRVVAKGIEEYHHTDNSMVVITHHKSLLDYIEPDFVHFLVDGRIVESGSQELIDQVVKSGFAAYKG
ncbi:MAG: Fe-S cluster assembly ATPase SufC [Firmicutes bacterium]|nr:Fe-S cluster assembly ATPase SufC [Bacillota bacterium]